MMIGYAQLWEVDPGAARAAGSSWHAQLDLVARRAAALTEATRRLRDGWSGSAARLAEGRLGRLAAELIASRPALIAVDQVLAGYAAELARAKAALARVVESAPPGVSIDRHGRVFLTPSTLTPSTLTPSTLTPPTLAPSTLTPPTLAPSSGSTPPGPAGPPAGAGSLGQAGVVAGVSAGIARAIELAERADRASARALSELTEAAGTGWTAAPPPGRPAPGSPPSAVRRWWDGLSPAARRSLVGTEPGLIGSLDGVPAAARDQANRLLLDHLRAELRNRQVLLVARRPIDPLAVLAADRVAGRIAGLDAVRERLTAEGGPRHYLLGLDAAGDGRAIVAVGDPDRSDNVLTYVPGMTTDLAGVDNELDRVRLVAARCAELAPTELSSAVLWLGYDAPDFVDEAAGPGKARDAGPDLHRFQEGLRASHDGPPGRQTVLGHSYGSLVVGMAARDHGLAADGLAFIGSPGVGVDRADQLGLPAGQVWASTATNDVIRYVAGGSELAGRALLATTGAGLPLAFGRPARQLWFGRDPSDPSFGGRIFPGAPHGHTGYWEPGNPALDGIARIALG